MMEFGRRNLIAKLEPDSVQKIDFLWREMRCMRPKIKNLVLSARKIELDGQLWFGIRQALPGQACEARVLDYGCLVGRTQHDGRRPQALRGAQHGFPPVGSGGNGQMDGFSPLFRNLDSSCEEFLFLQAEKLIMSQFVLASA